MTDTGDLTIVEMDAIPVIDTHIHVWTPNDPRFPMYIPPEEYPWWRGTSEEYIEEMEAAGVDRAVIVQIPYHEYDHAYALDARRRYPDRFAIVGLLDVHDAEAPRTLRRMVNADGIQGIRFSPGASDRLDSDSTGKLAQTAGELGVAIIVQIGPPQYERVGRLASLAEGTVFALDHNGRKPANSKPLPVEKTKDGVRFTVDGNQTKAVYYVAELP
jgi:predicted TIM-barrel fold metal-dependent hydrolase